MSTIGQGEAAEEWVKEFAKTTRISASPQQSLEQVVQLFNDRLQLRFNAARLHIDKFLPVANDWIDRIVSQKPLPKNSSLPVKQELTQKLLDLVLATDLTVKLKDNQGKDRLISIDVTANPDKQVEKLNTIQGKRADGDPKKFNRNRNLPAVREQMGIDKHLVLVINPNNPPSYEQLLAELYAFANSATKTRSLDLWNQTVKAVERLEDISPKGLWEKYSQQIEAKSAIERQVAVAHSAIQEGWEDKVNDILACDPAIQKIQQQQGMDKARSHIKTIVRAANLKQLPSEQRQESPQQQHRKNSRPQR
jgi:hypothetical protein